MSKRIISIGALALGSAAALAVGTGSLAGASSPSASTPPTLQQIQAKAGAAISQRVSALNTAVAKVDAAKNLGSDQAGLVTYLQRDIAPLGTLGQKIEGDTTVSQAEADYVDIFEDYRVYALVLPAADLAGRADAITVSALPALTAFSSQAQSKVTPTNQPTLQPMIDTLNGDISGATNASSGVASTVMSETPYDWNQNHSLLDPAKASVSTAEGDTKSARNEVQQIRQFLQQSHPAVTKQAPATTPTTAS
ncbi:MAG TPA: hypothetical protein VGG38_01665 [Acidimicrobiales bacterium]|jgi:hypothetical protein